MSACRIAIASIVVAILPIAGRASAQTGDSTSKGPGSSTARKTFTLPVEDRLAIQELFARYSQALDMGNGDEIVTNVFAPNGMFHDPSLCLIGHDELRKGLANHPDHSRTSQHWPNNIVITDVSGNTVKTHTYVIVFNSTRPGLTMGKYHDTLVKTGGKWLIQQRQVWRPGPVTQDPRCPTDLEKLQP